MKNEERVSIKRTINISGDFHYMIVLSEIIGFTERVIATHKTTKKVYDKLKDEIIGEIK